MVSIKCIARSAILGATLIATPCLAEGTRSAVTWQWIQTGDNADVVWTGAVRPPHGGGNARLIGGGDQAEIVYADTPRLAQPPRVARLTGGGDNSVITYGPQSGHAG